MPRKTKEEKERLLQQLQAEKQKGVFDQARQDDQVEQASWDREIAMLQRRVTTEYEHVDLGHGDLIKIRTRISLKEGRRVLELMKISQDKSMDAVSPEQRAEADAEILATATLNPRLTKEYFLDNPDKWSAVDSIPIIAAFFQSVEIKLRQVSLAAAFRQEPAGTEPG